MYVGALCVAPQLPSWSWGQASPCTWGTSTEGDQGVNPDICPAHRPQPWLFVPTSWYFTHHPSVSVPTHTERAAALRNSPLTSAYSPSPGPVCVSTLPSLKTCLCAHSTPASVSNQLNTSEEKFRWVCSRKGPISQQSVLQVNRPGEKDLGGEGLLYKTKSP